MMQPPETVTTPRLFLRQWASGDGELLGAAVAASVEHLRPWMPWVSFEPLSTAEREGRFEAWSAERAEGGSTIYGIFVGDTVVGGTGLHRRVGPGALEVGYWIHVDHIGLGYATEVACAMTDAAFTVSDIDHVEIHVDQANERSLRVPERLGYRLAAIEIRPIEAPGESGRNCRWVMTRGDWQLRVVDESN